MLYTADGRQLIERLWEETMAELDFANVRHVLKSMEYMKN